MNNPRIPLKVPAHKGMRFFKEVDRSLNLLVIEQPPQKRTISYLYPHGRGKSFLAFPYTLFFIEYHSNFEQNYKPPITLASFRVGFSNSTIYHSSDIIYKLPLGNFIGFRSCTDNLKNQRFENTPELVENMIGYFWQSKFTEIGQLSTWHHLTEMNYPVSNLASSMYKIEDIFRCLSNTVAFDDYNYRQST